MFASITITKEDIEGAALADELRRIADMIEQGYVGGEINLEDRRGWWDLQNKRG